MTNDFCGKKYEPPVRQGAGDAERESFNFPQYTSIENIQRRCNIEDGTEVVISEKIHGCVRAKNTKIRMSDGSHKRITQIRKGDYVLGEKNGQVIPSLVTNTFCNGPGDKWLKVKFTRLQAGKGSSFGSLTCTPNHRFHTPTGYVAAEDLSVGDTVSVRRSDPGLSYVAEQVLLGKLLGDGCLRIGVNSAFVEFGHVKQELTEWTMRGIGNLAGWRGERTSGYGSHMYVAKTIGIQDLKTKFECFYTPKKIVPEWVAEELSPLAMAFWYMDDGSLSHHKDQEDRALFACCNFTKEDCGVLQRGFKKFGINSTYYQSDNGGKKHSRLRLNADDAEKLFCLITPYIPEALQYKLPERHRGFDAWLPVGAYKPEIVAQKVLSIDKRQSKHHRYDLETETHNFFANEVLLHNSNVRMGYILDDLPEGQVWNYAVGSHKVRRKEGPGLYWQFMTEDVRTLLQDLSDYNNNANVVIYGEIFGNGVQDMDYGCDMKALRVFDIAINGEYQHYDLVEKWCRTFDIETVPLLYRGPFSKQKVEELTYGHTTFSGVKCKFKGREGCVVKPVIESLDYRGNRLILKSVSADYRNRRGATDDS